MGIEEEDDEEEKKTGSSDDEILFNTNKHSTDIHTHACMHACMHAHKQTNENEEKKRRGKKKTNKSTFTRLDLILPYPCTPRACKPKVCKPKVCKPTVLSPHLPQNKETRKERKQNVINLSQNKIILSSVVSFFVLSFFTLIPTSLTLIDTHTHTHSLQVTAQAILLIDDLLTYLLTIHTQGISVNTHPHNYTYINSTMIPSYGIEDPSNGMSFKNGKIGRGVSQMFNPADSFTHYYSSAINTSPSQGAPPPYSVNSTRSGSISSPISGPPSPTQSFKGFLGRSISSVAEEGAQFQQQQQQQQQHQQQQAHEMEEYRPSLQWLQQTCRPVFMKELTQLHNVPVPITAATAKHPSQIGGSQTVLVASWKQCQVHVLPIDRWGSPQEVLHEVSLFSFPLLS